MTPEFLALYPIDPEIEFFRWKRLVKSTVFVVLVGGLAWWGVIKLWRMM